MFFEDQTVELRWDGCFGFLKSPNKTLLRSFFPIKSFVIQQERATLQTIQPSVND